MAFLNIPIVHQMHQERAQKQLYLYMKNLFRANEKVSGQDTTLLEDEKLYFKLMRKTFFLQNTTITRKKLTGRERAKFKKAV